MDATRRSTGVVRVSPAMSLMHNPPDACTLTLFITLPSDAKRRAAGEPRANSTSDFTSTTCKFLPAFFIVGFSTSRMAASMTRVRQIRSLVPQLKHYSSASTPVKRLGVIGAGQMVSWKACDNFKYAS